MPKIGELKEIGHRWSGWPGAWCLDCGIGDPIEDSLACDNCKYSEDDEPQFCSAHAELISSTAECPEPNSHRHDPYHHA